MAHHRIDTSRIRGSALSHLAEHFALAGPLVHTDKFSLYVGGKLTAVMSGAQIEHLLCHPLDWKDERLQDEVFSQTMACIDCNPRTAAEFINTTAKIRPSL